MCTLFIRDWEKKLSVFLIYKRGIGAAADSIECKIVILCISFVRRKAGESFNTEVYNTFIRINKHREKMWEGRMNTLQKQKAAKKALLSIFHRLFFPTDFYPFLPFFLNGFTER